MVTAIVLDGRLISQEYSGLIKITLVGDGARVAPLADAPFARQAGWADSGPDPRPAAPRPDDRRRAGTGHRRDRQRRADASHNAGARWARARRGGATGGERR